jgi:putative tryptophan/tyrosine transport system substrate-binding protein
LTRRRPLLALIALATGFRPLSSPSSADAQQPTSPRRIGVLFVSRPSEAKQVQAFRQALLDAGYSEGRDGLNFVEVRTPEEFPEAFTTINREHAQALYIIEDSLYLAHRTRILNLASRARLPTVSGNREFADEGGLMTHGPNFADMYRRSAEYVDKILKGAKPADLPIEQPTKFELVVNLKTAKALGITIPETILLRADEVIR